MAIEIISARLESLKHQRLITDEQATFLLRVATIAHKALPYLDDGTDTLIACKKGIELTNKWGVRAFYLDGESQAYYYQYQRRYFYAQCIEPTKVFGSFSDREIRSLLKRKRFV